MRKGGRQDLTPGSMAGLRPRSRILNHHAIRRSDPEDLRTLQIRLRMRFAISHQSAVTMCCGTGIPAKARRLRASRSVAEVTMVQNFCGSDCRIDATPSSTSSPSLSPTSRSSITLSSAHVIRVRLERAHRFNGPHAMSGLDRFPHIEAMALRPGLPASLHRSQELINTPSISKSRPFVLTFMPHLP